MNMKNKGLFVAMGILVVVGMGLIVYSLKPRHQKTTKQNLVDKQAQADLKYINETDKFNLANSGQANEGEIIKAFRRLGSQAAPDLKQFIQKYKNHPSGRVRAAVVEAAGAFHEPEYRQLVLEALKDSNPKIRLAAVKALGRQGSTKPISSFRTICCRNSSIR